MKYAQITRQATYDLAGRMIAQTDGMGNTSTFQYNNLGLLRKATYPGDETIASNTVIFQYDKAGNLKSSRTVQEQLTHMNMTTYTGYYPTQGKTLMKVRLYGYIRSYIVWIR